MHNFSHSPAINKDSLIDIINKLTYKWNKDNITRTKAYLEFYKRHPEVKWAFLASMVSRNAGYSMCDLESPLYKDVLSSPYRKALFMAYEKANYLIFKDAFPQLLLYHYSTYLENNLFHYLRTFSVSSFMEKEWDNFWKERNEWRLMTSLIINEQNLIQEPVIEDSFFHSQVFSSLLFTIQDLLKFSMVVFPTLSGELYGAAIHQFKRLDSRILFGKKLAKILFNETVYFPIFKFAIKTEHTGSRTDYEKFIYGAGRSDTPYLRMAYPVIKHSDSHHDQWDKKRIVKSVWHKDVDMLNEYDISRYYAKKRSQIRMILACKSCLNNQFH